MKNKNLTKLFKGLKIKKNDLVMIHGDAGITANLNKEDSLNFFFDEIIKYLGRDGTILIPSFTYSFCKTQKFNVLSSKSEVGLFSEAFRLRKDTFRTSHPIFSFSIYGKLKNFFLKSENTTCFGKNSLFEKFHKKNGLIISLGRNLEYGATFLHYIEESLNVKYRFNKTFYGKVYYKKKEKNTKVNYYVRNLKLNSSLKHKKDLHKILNKQIFNRYLNLSIRSKKLFLFCKKKIKKNELYLID